MYIFYYFIITFNG